MAPARKRRLPGDDTSSSPENSKRKSTKKRRKGPVQADSEVIEIPSRAPSPSPAASYQAQLDKESRGGSNAVIARDEQSCSLMAGSSLTTTVSADDPAGPSYDVCFGLLILEATCQYREWDPPPEAAPVQISFHDNILLLQYEGSGKRAGLLVSEALSRLVKECSITLVATIGTFNGQRRSDPLSFSLTSVRTRPLRVIVYGMLSEKDKVANVLDESDVFFQRPEGSEYDRRVRYLNPMYLLPPGEDMPIIGGPSISAGRGQMAAPLDEVQLGEVERSRVLRIFDEASGADSDVPFEVKQSSRIVSTLKDHQVEALAMMVEREHGPLDNKPRFPSLWEKSVEEGGMIYRHVVTSSPQGSPLPSLRGGILADEMGLGKTLSTLALICHDIDRISGLSPSQASRVSRASLIVTPKSTIYGWQEQIKRHIKPGGIRSFVYHGSKRQDAASELHTFDVVITTYDTLRSDWTVYGPLYTQKWARIILDEAHKIRNRSSKIFHATCEIPAHYRWCLTGTPIQNSLDDFGSLLAFIGVPPFVTRDQFRFWISSPALHNRQHSLQTLRKLVRATCLRRTKALPRLSSTLNLPPKTEHLEIVELAPDERELYDFFKRRSYLLTNENSKPGHPKAGSKASRAKTARRRPRTAAAAETTAEVITRRRSAGNIIVLISVLRMICDHGEALLPRVALQAWRNRDAGAVGWGVLQTAAETKRSCCICGRGIDGEEEEGQKQEADVVEFSCNKHVACEACVAAHTEDDDAPRICPACSTTTEDISSASASPCRDSQVYSPSSKISALLRNILPTLKSKNDAVDGTNPPVKSIIFSHWTGMLDLICDALTPHLSLLGVSSARIDGRSTLQQRRDALDRFNSDDGCVVMLATIGAVGEGIDLSVASEAHVVEPHWNPMAEAQAVDRVHRIGQTREVKVTRYCVQGSVEEYIQWIQASKLRLISESLSSGGQGMDERKEEEDLIEERWKKLLEFLK